ncbi:MAG: hypothetical protein EBZ48_13985 [Proteobacteria bacterium]|nr:hypothetical protein [Pseudomonadota bacterium]
MGKRKSLPEAVPWVGPEPLNADFWIPDVPIEVVYVQELAKLCLKTAPAPAISLLDDIKVGQGRASFGLVSTICSLVVLERVLKGVCAGGGFFFYHCISVDKSWLREVERLGCDGAVQSWFCRTPPLLQEAV